MKVQRREERLRSFIGARIVAAGRLSSFDCEIRNLSTRGAKLVVHYDIPLPAEFELWVSSKNAIFPTRVRWRGMHVVGVEFLGAPLAMGGFEKPLLASISQGDAKLEAREPIEPVKAARILTEARLAMSELQTRIARLEELLERLRCEQGLLAAASAAVEEAGRPVS